MVECLSKEVNRWMVLRQCSCPCTLVDDDDDDGGEMEERIRVAGTSEWLLGKY